MPGAVSNRQRRALLARLKQWFDAHGRTLPWRGERDPYRVWLREIMLQQTTVTAVVPYFERFLTRFPTVETLAAADESEVLRLWEGLGYYRRARNLHRTAQRLASVHSGVFPADVEQLAALPGIGRYTAGAIASFAFEQPAPIVEANTRRLHARLLGYDGELTSRAGQALLWSSAEFLVAGATVDFPPSDINQALMDLGATVCTPDSPRCGDCPLHRWCRARAEGRQHELPRLPTRPATTDVLEATVAVRSRRGYLLRQRPPGERWAGLWDFPRFAIEDDQVTVSTLMKGVRAQTGLTISIGPQIAELRHSVTRFRITLRCFTATVKGGRLLPDSSLEWVPPAHFANYALSVTGRKLANRLCEGLLP